MVWLHGHSRCLPGTFKWFAPGAEGFGLSVLLSTLQAFGSPRCFVAKLTMSSVDWLLDGFATRQNCLPHSYQMASVPCSGPVCLAVQDRPAHHCARCGGLNSEAPIPKAGITQCVSTCRSPRRPLPTQRVPPRRLTGQCQLGRAMALVVSPPQCRGPRPIPLLLSE